MQRIATITALLTLMAHVTLTPATLKAAGDDARHWLSVTDHGAVADGTTNSTRAIQQAIDAAAQAGGGTVFFPAGNYVAGTLYLKSGVRLHLDFAATLLGSTDATDYPVNQCKLRSYTDNYVCQAFIWGEGLHDVAITGHGVIDGRGAAFHGRPWRQRPYLIRLISCRNVRVEDVTMRNSAMWMQHYLDCDHLRLRSIHVTNHGNANNDMIDIDACRDVIVSDCYGDSDDDALTLKSTIDRACENVVVSNCLLSSHCNAIKMGTESNGGFKNITITGCAIRPSQSDSRIAGRPTGLAGIALEVVDGGTLDGVTISNMTIRGTATPIFLRLGDRARPFVKGMPRPIVGSFRNVRIENIVATGAGKTGCSITGLPGHPIRHVTLRSISLELAGGGTAGDAARKIPELAAKYPESQMFGTLPAYGFYCRHVTGLTLADVDLRTTAADDRPAIVCDDVRDLRIDALTARGQLGSAPLVVFRDVRGAMIRGYVAPAERKAFLKIGAGSQRITAVANDLAEAAMPFDVADGLSADVLYARANRR